MNPFAKLGNFTIEADSMQDLSTNLIEFFKSDKYTAVVCPLDVTCLELAVEVNSISR